MTETLEAIAEKLGYSQDRGFVAASAFAHQPNHRHALRLAAQDMGVRAAFGLWTGPEGALNGPDHRRYTPLVYLAEATDVADAQRIHRSVWSQGLAPYLIVRSPDRVWLCQGFAYSASDWRRYAVEVGPSDWDGLDDPETLAVSILRPVLARTLRSSLEWRDQARAADDFIDERLLRSLAELSIQFSAGYRDLRPLEPQATNALIARLLYFYFLVDRRFITEERLSAWGLSTIGLGEGAPWPLTAARSLFDRLDEVFNGSIFPMPAEHVQSYDAGHVNTLRQVLRHGAEASGGGALQLSFLDYDFASIRTETLSAIYEMFLRNEVEDAGKRYGAFYTPPYLADYMLDRLEDEHPLTEGVRVLDPAAGSGVFLVGAYRRIVEATLPAGQTTMGLPQLHTLMTQAIFAVELNPTACHVAAFSLYLTMLDYVEPAEAADYTSWPRVTGRARLFPPMLKGVGGARPNIRAADFFSVTGEDLRCDVVIGNPPWVQLPALSSEAADAYLKARKKKDRKAIGDKQAAELFTWKAYEDHLEPDGALAFLIPQKSLVNTYSEGFVHALRERTELIGVADLAHLRYALFRRSGVRTAGSADARENKSARQATAAILLRKRLPRPGRRFWSFRPLRPTQPSSRRDRLWILLHDWTQVTWHVQTELDGRAWRRVFTCAAVDRRLLSQFDRRISAGALRRLADLGPSIGLEFKIEVDQNIDARFILTTDVKKPTYWLGQLGLEPSLLPEEPDAIPLPQTEIDKAVPPARPFLKGNVVLMPRNCERAVFVEPPVASKFMIVAAFPAYAGQALPANRRRLLEALAAYMSTRLFRYLCFINGRRMTIDRPSIELSAVTELPWPFGDPGDPALDTLVSMDGEAREAFVAKALGLPDAYRAIAREFDQFRERFRDGGTPPGALDPAGEDQVIAYTEALLHEIDMGKARHAVCSASLGDDLAAALVRYVGSKGCSDGPSNADIVGRAYAAYRHQGASGLTQSRYLWHSREDMASVLIKPLERLHWTLDRAFADADLISAAVLAGATTPSQETTGATT